MNEFQEKIFDEIEGNLLSSMKGIDNAVFNIGQKLNPDKYGKELDSLIECKKKIKKVLNDHFDQCARNK